jgi:hypothetical protein
MTYDIGIGRCTELGEDTVVVKLESVMVKRLSPTHPWQRSGTSLLRLNRSLCSATRPPEADREVYLDRAALSKRTMAALDIAGNGSSVSVDLRALLNDLDPQPSAGPQSKSRPGDHRKQTSR